MGAGPESLETSCEIQFAPPLMYNPLYEITKLVVTCVRQRTSDAVFRHPLNRGTHVLDNVHKDAGFVENAGRFRAPTGFPSGGSVVYKCFMPVPLGRERAKTLDNHNHVIRYLADVITITHQIRIFYQTLFPPSVNILSPPPYSIHSSSRPGGLGRSLAHTVHSKGSLLGINLRHFAVLSCSMLP